MLYKSSQSKELDSQLFFNPASEYRAAPFWAWNCKLDKKQLLRQISYFKTMGMGGFHIHSRVGLDTEYLGKEFFECVHACENEAQKQNLLLWLYDEDRWPSGTGGGIVTKEQKYRSRFLVFTPYAYEEKKETGFIAAVKAIRSENRTLLGHYRINLNTDGSMFSYEKVSDPSAGQEALWSVYLEVSGDTPWFNNQAYVNTLDKKAIDRFIEVTHEKYYSEMKKGFGTTIPAIFTDEPQITHKGITPSPFSKEPVILPFTDDFDETFIHTYHYSILDRLPEVLWEMKTKRVSEVRYHYHRHLCERFSEAYGDNIGKWCEEHGISLTGHMMNERTLYSQTLAIGEIMRPMKNFGIPGVDMLCNRREYSTVKQAQSVARQFGREGVMSELYGVTGWDFDFRNHKLAGDWQAALGVTVRVPHLTWVSMEGEGKRDYPASIGYQSPWYQEYSDIENHFARLNTAMTRGKAFVRTAVIHPIESYWLYWGNRLQTSVKRQAIEDNFSNLIEWLIFNLIDFDFISEAILSEETEPVKTNRFPMGNMSYEAVIVPECHTIRRTTLNRLQAFKKCGGEVIFMGNPPEYIDAVESKEPLEFAAECTRISYNRANLLETLDFYRDIDIEVTDVDGDDPSRVKHRENGCRADNMFYQLREDNNCRWLFICHVNKVKNEFITGMQRWTVKINGCYKPVIYNTMTGEITPVAAKCNNGITVIEYYGSAHDSLLLKLEPSVETIFPGVSPKPCIPEEVSYLPDPVSYELEESNVLLLDMAEYAFDEEEWQEREEILRIDNLFRRKLGYPLRMEALAQPWTQKEEENIRHKLKLRFHIEAQISLDKVFLAMENPEQARILWNGYEAVYKECGWFTDECIKKTVLFGLKAGSNTLEIQIPFGNKTNVEWCYLLGDFGVALNGSRAVITEKPKNIFYGDYTRQGLPFYAGNLTYITKVSVPAGRLYLETSHYRGALVQVFVDGKRTGNIFLAPYRLDCGYIEAGKHEIGIKIFGNRINAFGAVHNADITEEWYGPNLWRTSGIRWSYEYQLKDMGILIAPHYWVAKE